MFPHCVNLLSDVVWNKSHNSINYHLMSRAMAHYSIQFQQELNKGNKNVDR